MNTNFARRFSRGRIFVQFVAGTACLLVLTPISPVQAAEQEWQCSGPRISTVPDGPAPLFSPASGGFTIAVTFDASVPAAHRPVLQFAVNEWDALLQSRGVNPANYPVTISYGAPPNPNALAETGTLFGTPSGVLVRADMVIDPNRPWYVDPNPADDVEFANNPPAGFDLLSVVRHELGHALGWVGAGNGKIDPLLANGVFDASRLNIALTANGHADATAHPGELIQPSIGTRTRRRVALYPIVAFVSRAFEYQMQMQMQFVDPGFTGNATGTAWAPWRSFTEANNSAPADMPLLLAPQMFTVTNGAQFNARRLIQSARGGALIIGQ